MLTNEQRAHDIAIAMLPTMVCMEPTSDELDDNGNVNRDAVEIYLSIYNIEIYNEMRWLYARIRSY